MRIVYRLIEFVGGVDPNKNPLPFREIYSYVLDALPMMLALLILLIFNPGRILQGSNADFVEFRREKKQQKKAEKSAKKDAKRTLKEEKKAAKNGKTLSYTEEPTNYNPYHYDSV